ncbi:MAG: molybdopterin-dependent oxidoreductase, partial [Pseudomonadota bacterium]|nr:molybdopterin-dependent oxidoreductase [Pseudomonadota bacterium]
MAWCHPILFQRVRAAHSERKKNIVVIDPRRTDSVAIADLHLPLKPGSDVLLWNGLLNYLKQQGHLDNQPSELTDGLDDALAQVAELSIETVATGCELSPDAVLEFYQLFAANEKVLTAFCMGVNQSSSGSDKASAIINAHLATGRIGKPGMGPFSLTGQPNAMGGREVGALANLLASHFDLAKAQDRATVEQFWQAPARIPEQPGVTASEVAKAIRSGRIKFLWVMSTNPAVSITEASDFIEASQQLDMLVVSDCVNDTATLRLADVRLPAAGWSEKSGTVTNSERRISRQRALVPAYEQAKPDWWALSQVAQRLGYQGFDYQNEQEIFVEHAKLSNIGPDRAFRLGALAKLAPQQYDELEPIQWPVAQNELKTTQKRLFEKGDTDHSHRRAKLIPLTPRPPASSADQAFPLLLNTGRIRDQWHTMTRTGLAARLNEHISEPFLQVHPSDANRYNILDDQLVTVRSARGQVLLRAQLTDDVRQGEVFAPMHWSIQSKMAQVGRLIAGNVDPASKQPEFKITPVIIEPFAINAHGQWLCEEALFETLKPQLESFDYFSYR